MREALKLTQSQLAVELGVSVASVHRWERGRVRPSGMAIKTLRDFLRMRRLPQEFGAHYLQLRNRAVLRVGRAVVNGILPRLSDQGPTPPEDVPCADCAGLASVYDHRDYYKPLDVSPVCNSCNTRRGKALDTMMHPEFWALSLALIEE